MKIKFWGTRGSLAKPGTNTLRYGGNTSCIELTTAANTLIIVDCGTGAHELGQALIRSNQYNHGHMLISHTHWDHIQGIPFFAPLFLPNWEWNIYGPKGSGRSIQESLSGQMQHTYFPVSLQQLNANIHYHDLVKGIFHIEDTKITTYYLNHTTLTLAFRFEVDGIILVYACDHEPYSSQAATGAIEPTGQDLDYAEFLKDADLVIHDAQYIAEEYPEKKGWGHSTMEYIIALCKFANVKKLILTHHDPLRNDDDLEQLILDRSKKLKNENSTLEIAAATEETEITLEPSIKDNGELNKRRLNSLQINSAMPEYILFLCVIDPAKLAILSEASQSDGVQIRWASPNNILEQIKAQEASLIIMEHNPPQIDALNVTHQIQKMYTEAQRETPPIILVASQEENIQDHTICDWLVAPFSVSYARMKIHASLLHLNARWEKAKTPANENERLNVLHQLNLLDTPTEERFDRIIRLATSLFNVPIAYISLVDNDRQWFKSCAGITDKETSREVAFCAHVVYENKLIVVEDTLLDDRFADNPLVLNEPHLRFYAGYPLTLKNGHCIGTICIADTRPRVLREKDIKILEDLRDLVIKEIMPDKTN